MRRTKIVGSLLALMMIAAPTTTRGDAVADSATVLRARIRVDAVDAEARARSWNAALDRAGAPDSARATALDVLAAALLEDAHWSGDAVAIGEAAITRWQRARGERCGEAGASSIGLGRLHYRRGELELARVCVSRGLAWCEPAGPTFARDVYRGVRYLANIEEERAEFADAERLYRRAIDLAARLYGVDAAEYGNALNSLGVMCRKTGRLSEARVLYQRALDIREHALGPADRDLVFNLNNLGNLLSQMGDGESARALLERALAIASAAYGPRHPYTAQSLGNLADVEAALGDTMTALASLRRSVELEDSSEVPNRPEQATRLDDLGNLETATGDTARARVDLLRGMSMRLGIYGPDHPEVARSGESLARLAMRRGDFATAERLCSEVLATRERWLGPSHPDVARILVLRGWARRALGRPDDALEDALVAERISTDHLRATTRVLEERVALRYALTRPSGLDLALMLAAEDPADTGQARRVWDMLIHSRALVMDEMARRHREVVASDDSLTRSLSAGFTAASERLAWLLADAGNEVPDSAARARVVAARLARDQSEAALAERSARFRGDVLRSTAGLAQVTAALDSGAALVAFVRYVPALGARDRGCYLAFVRGADTHVRIVPLGAAGTLEMQVRRWCGELAHRPSAITRLEDEQRCRAAGLAVRERLWAPIASACAGATHILIVPDGIVQRVPFAALPWPGSGFQAEHGAPIHLLGAERDVATDRTATPPGRGLLVVGAPQFDRYPDVVESASRGRTRVGRPRSDCQVFRALRFDPLPGSRTEVENVERRWLSAGGEQPVSVLFGARADERAVRAMAPGTRVIHLATHGFFLDAACARNDQLDSLALEDPLLRSGVALAGANIRTERDTGEDDGILTAAEVATLDLAGVEWVVLSACESGGGEIRDGEGVLGLRRGFTIAGARTLVSSLWSVDDVATARWMDALYAARFSRRHATAQALQDADRAILRVRRADGDSDHPYFWAGFVAAGDWR